MTSTMLQPDEAEGWHGRIRDGKVVEESDEGDESLDQQDGGSDDEDNYRAEEDDGSDDEDYDEDYDEDEDYEDEDEDEDEDDAGGASDQQSRRRPAATRGGR